MSTEQEIRYVAVGVTDVGRVREHNEDNFLAVDLASANRGASGMVLDGAMGVKGVSLVVADGMGGAAAGEVASKMAVDYLHDSFLKADLGGSIQSEQAVIELLESTIHKANESIYTKGQTSKDHQGMGTTLTVAVVVGDSVYLSQVGDSRGYLLRKGKLVQMTRDQSLISQLIEEGTITPEQAEQLGGKNIILQALGVEEHLKIDSKRYDVLKGDTLLLCSDGLTGMVKDAEIEKILLEEADLKVAAKRLIDAANAGGGKDNITCILARFDGPGLREPLTALDHVEQTGERWKTEKVKTSKAGPVAMGVAAAILAVVAWIVFRPQPRDLVFTVNVDAKVVVSAAADGGTEGFAPLEREVKQGQPLKLQVEKGKYDIEVSAPGYVAYRKPSEDTTGDRQLFEYPVTLVRTPAKSLLLLPPKVNGVPLTNVTVLLTALDAKVPAVTHEVKKWDAPQFNSFPAGKCKAEASRPGFEPKSWDFDVGSEKDVVAQIPDLQGIAGTVLVLGAAPGSDVTVYDGEELLAGPVKTDNLRRTVLQVRATTVRVKVEKPGFEPFDDSRVAVPREAEVEVRLDKHRGKVRFTGLPAGAVLTLQDSSGKAAPMQIEANGETSQRPCAPGPVEVSYEDARGQPRTLKFDLEPGQILEKDLSK